MSYIYKFMFGSNCGGGVEDGVVETRVVLVAKMVGVVVRIKVLVIVRYRWSQ